MTPKTEWLSCYDDTINCSEIQGAWDVRVRTQVGAGLVFKRDSLHCREVLPLIRHRHIHALCSEWICPAHFFRGKFGFI